MSQVSPQQSAASRSSNNEYGHTGVGHHLDARRRSLKPTRAVAMKASPTSMRFDAVLPFETWTTLGSRIGVHANASSWWLGDWLIFGRMKYGRRYKEAVARTGLDYQTLRNYAVVGRRFEPARRRGDLTFQHHAEVTALSDAEQDAWLSQAAAGSWSKQELRRRISASRGSAPTVTLRIPVDADRERRWRSAADRSDCPLELWIPRMLDAACESCS